MSPSLKVFLRGIVRVIPYIVPIAVVAVIMLSYFAYMALRLFNHNHRREEGPLEVSYCCETQTNKWQAKVIKMSFWYIVTNTRRLKYALTLRFALRRTTYDLLVLPKH